jgi:arylsulfatase A-like enzyme
MQLSRIRLRVLMFRTFRMKVVALFAVLTVCSVGTGCGGSSTPGITGTPMPNVILISIDTMRADHLGCYGYPRATSPVLDSLAATGTRFANCQAQAPWTLPSHASIFTGLSAVSHGAGLSFGRLTGIEEGLPTLPEMLSKNGYNTAGIVNVSFLAPSFGFDRGFRTYNCLSADTSLNARQTLSRAADFMEYAVELPEPFFLFVHLWDVHAPYTPPAPFDTLFTDSLVPNDGYWFLAADGSVMERYRDLFMGLYDGEIACTDQQLRAFFRKVRELGIADSTLIIVLSDHGEEFLEHGGVDHGTTLFQEVLHVPLIISGPGVPVAVVDSPVGLFDVFPSILAFLGIEAPPDLDGRDILGSPILPDRMIPSSGIENMESKSRSQMVAMRRGSEKLIYDMVTEVAIWFDLSTDASEQTPLEHPAADLVAEVQYYWSTPPRADPTEVTDPHELMRLRSLGYLH